MDTRYNILYFSNNVDIRLCPKNATVSLKAAYNMCHEPPDFIYDSDGSYRRGSSSVDEPHRKHNVDTYSYWVDFPYRKNSIRIAVVRDPVKRFMSACNYYIRQQHRYANKIYDAQWYKDNHDRGEPCYPEIVTKTVRGMINQLEKRDIYDSHFYSQTHYLGHPDDYDIVYEINDLNELFNYLNKNCNPKNHIPPLRKNTSDSYKSFGRTLTEDDIVLIKEFYSKDYKRGWYTKESI